MAFGTAVNAEFGGNTEKLAQASTQSVSLVQRFADSARDLGSKAAASLGEVGMGLLKGFIVTDVAGKVLGWLKDIGENVKRLAATSRELDVGTDALQAFEKAVKKTNGSVEEAHKIWEKARDSLDGLMSGEEGATKAFEQLHLRAADFKGLNLEQSLEKIAQAYVKNRDEAGAYGALLDILGKRNVPQIQEALVALGTKGFGGLKEASDGFFSSLSAQGISSLDEFTRNAMKPFTWLKNALGNLAADVVEGWQVLGGLGAAAWNFVTGVKTDWDAVFLSTQKTNKAVASITDEQDKLNRKTAEHKGQLSEIEQQHQEQFKSQLAIASGQEKINTLASQLVSLQLASSNIYATQAEKEAAAKEAARVKLELEKAISEEKKKHAEAATKEQEEFDKLVAKAEKLQRDRELGELPLAERVLQLERERNAVMEDRDFYEHGSQEWAEREIKFDQLDNEYQKARLDLLKQQTKELDEQEKRRKAAEKAIKNFGNNGEMYLAGGLYHYDDPQQQAAYERQATASYIQQLQDEIAQHQKNLATYKSQPGSIYSSYLANSEQAAIDALRYRQAHAYQAIFDVNYSDALGGSVLAQQIQQLGQQTTLKELNDNVVEIGKSVGIITGRG